ncbi:MAG: carboxypeptidase regulatory-like domain-containing protein [bacterium]|nr:carboxypeptidase regulatory-like domain-containing protein [bacterium]
MFHIDNKHTLAGITLLALIFGTVEIAPAQSPVAATQPAIAPPVRFHVTVSYPTAKGVSKTLVTLKRRDRGIPRIIEQCYVKGGVAVFKTEVQQGMWLECRSTLGELTYRFTHGVRADHIRSKSMNWQVKLDPMKHMVCRAINKTTGNPVEGADIVIRRKKTGRAVSSSTHPTDVNGLVTLSAPPSDVDAYVSCGRMSGGPGLGTIYIRNEIKSPLAKNRSLKKIIEVPVNVPVISLKVTAALKTKTGLKPWNGRDGTVYCKQVVPAKRYASNRNRSFSGFEQRVALFTNLHPGKYRLHMKGSRDHYKYATLSPERVVVKKGQTTEVKLIVQLADEYRGRFEGSVVGVKGPIAGAEIRLERKKGGYSKSVKTDKKGTFAFTEVPGGLCSLVVEAKGYRKFTTREVTVPSEPLKVELYRQIRLGFKVNGGAKAYCGVFYQTRDGKMREHSNNTDANGAASLTLSREGPYVTYIRTRDSSKAVAGRLLRIDDDLEINETLRTTRKVVLSIRGVAENRYGSMLMLVGTDNPTIVPGGFRRGMSSTFGLLPGTYEVYIGQRKDKTWQDRYHFVHIASKWTVPDRNGISTIEVPMDLGTPKSRHEIFSDMLRRNGVKPLKRIIRQPTTWPDGDPPKPLKMPETQPASPVVKVDEKYRGPLAGSVIGSKGPLGGVAVRLELIRGGYSKSVKTDKTGAFAFTEVPGGPCRMVVAAKGYAGFYREVRVPCQRLKVQLDRSIRLRIKIKDGANVSCSLQFQDSVGKMKAQHAATDANGEATVFLPSYGMYIFHASYYGQKRATRLLKIDGDSEVTATLRQPRKVTLILTGAKYAEPCQLLFVGTNSAATGSGKLSGYTVKNLSLLPGMYDIFLPKTVDKTQPGKNRYVQIASKWIVPGDGETSSVEVLKKFGPIKSSEEIFSEMLQRHDAKSGKGVTPTKKDRIITTRPQASE